MMEYVYILECADGSYYTGWTNDLAGRYQAHKERKGAKYTKSHPPVRIAHAEGFLNRTDAQSREFHIKKLTHEEKKELVKLSDYPANISVEEIIRRITNMEELKIYRCNKCKKTFAVIRPHGCPTMCCGEEMTLLKANDTDGALEKHVPAVEREGNLVKVTVGSVEHPMLDAHYIEFIALQTEKGFSVVNLNPGEKPYAEFTAEGPVTVYEFCNLHGLWKAEA